MRLEGFEPPTQDLRIHANFLARSNLTHFGPDHDRRFDALSVGSTGTRENSSVIHSVRLPWTR